MKTIKIRVINLFVLFRVLVSRLFSGVANKIDLKNIKTIIVFHDGKLGDMVCATPLFRAIKTNLPNVKLVVFGDAVNKEVIKYNNDIDEYVVLHKTNVFLNTKNAKKYNADFALTLTPGFFNLAPLLLSSINFVATPKVENGWSPYETIPYKIVRRYAVSIPHRMGSYAPGEYLKMLEPLNIFTQDTTKHLNFSPEAKDKVIDILTKNLPIREEDLLVCLSPSSGNKVKNWHSERFAELANKISATKKTMIVIIGGKNDKLEVEKMKNKLDEKIKYVDLCGLLTIDELKAVISQMDVFISVDTGPIYIAEAFGVPTIDIVGPMDEKEQPPIGEKHLVVCPKERVAPELHIMNARAYNFIEARRQVDSITVEQVLETWQQLLPKLQPSKDRFFRAKVE
jgi:heptosyltransferase-2